MSHSSPSSISTEDEISVLDDFIDDLILELALGIHRDVKTGRLTMLDCFDLSTKRDHSG